MLGLRLNRQTQQLFFTLSKHDSQSFQLADARLPSGLFIEWATTDAQFALKTGAFAHECRVPSLSLSDAEFHSV
jgi:hypothetical protein